jgi:hypothetical protein
LFLPKSYEKRERAYIKGECVARVAEEEEPRILP